MKRNTVPVRSRVAMTIAVSTFMSIALIFTGVLPATAQQKKVAKQKPNKVEKTRGTAKDENITSESFANKANAVKQPLTHRAKTKSRGGDKFVSVVVLNNTPLLIQIFMDGKIRGAVGPEDALTVITAPGKKIFYARALLEDGSVITWGPQKEILSEDFDWVLEKEENDGE